MAKAEEALDTGAPSEFGDETMRLGLEQGVTCFFANLPAEGSWEAAELQHGVFTYALLETLKEPPISTGLIARHLNNRLPELSTRLGKPKQTPWLVAPSGDQILIGEPERLATQGVPQSRIYPVWFGTNRRPIDSQNLSKGFSAEQDNTNVYHGLCKIIIPQSHKFGSLGTSWQERFWKAHWWDKLRLNFLAEDRLTLKDISILIEEDFWETTRNTLATSHRGGRMALVLIHGFNVSFQDAAIRAAQMGFDLNMPGIVGFFSWPSKGRLGLLEYAADGESIQASEKQITEFLIGFAEKAGAERVHVLAHSMGNRGLLRAMQQIVHAAAKASAKPFGHIIFTAPDVNAAVVRDLAKAHQVLAERTTLYLSSHDLALKGAGLIYAGPRAGFVPPVTIVEGIDTVEVSDVDLSNMGHGYYGEAQAVLNDLHQLIVFNAPPATRMRLDEVALPEGNYWRIAQ
jgi:esterase/lipase superfamily enzyme